MCVSMISGTVSPLTLVKWYKEGADVQTLLPVLSTYLGHSHLEDISIYLSMTYELLDKADIRFKTYVES